MLSLECADGTSWFSNPGAADSSLATLPAEEFPVFSSDPTDIRLELTNRELKDLLLRTQFAMAQQDVRYYLNGLLLEIQAQHGFVAVATDGHRLAMAELSREHSVKKDTQVILPRKTVLELQRLLDTSESPGHVWQ